MSLPAFEEIIENLPTDVVLQLGPLGKRRAAKFSSCFFAFEFETGMKSRCLKETFGVELQQQ